MPPEHNMDVGSPYVLLDDYYAGDGVPLPSFTQLDGNSMPEPQRQLLVHKQDMTSKLSDYYGQPIHLHLLKLSRLDTILVRHVVLALDGNRQPVEFGSINIDLAQFSGQPRNDILECWKPFGGILNEYGIPYESNPSTFFSVQSDSIMNSAFGLASSRTLFGRFNRLTKPSGECLAEVVEILPPMDQKLDND